MAKIQLEPRNTDSGAEMRLLLAECRGPSIPGYTLGAAKRCMQLMDLVLWNRLNNNPGQFMAKNAKSIVDIIKAPGQFRGFEKYPNYDQGIVARLQSMIDIANNVRDSRQSAFFDFVTAAIDVSFAKTIADPSGGIAAAWRTAGASSPGSAFTFFETSGGNDFYRL